MVDVARDAPDFGFPDCFGQGGPACRGTRRPLARLAAHAAPGAVAVVGHGPTRATAYVPEFGSSFNAQPTGGDVVAVALTRHDGRWRASRSRLARGLGRQNPLGAALGPDGRLYVSLWSRGRVVAFRLPPPTRPRAARRATPRRIAVPRPPVPPALFTRLDPWAPGGIGTPLAS